MSIPVDDPIPAELIAPLTLVLLLLLLPDPTPIPNPLCPVVLEIPPLVESPFPPKVAAWLLALELLLLFEPLLLPALPLNVFVC